MGHDGPPTNYWRENLITNDPLTRCPLRTLQLAPAREVEEMARYVDQYYPAWQAGHLLTEGGIADQPARYLSMIEHVARFAGVTQAKKDELAKNQTPVTDEAE